MDFNAICRTCLGTTLLKPIFPIRKLHKKFSNSIFLITGVKIISGKLQRWSASKNMCGVPKNNIKFRAKCKESEDVLKNITKEAKKSVLFGNINIKNIYREQNNTITNENNDNGNDDDINDQIKTIYNESLDNNENPIQDIIKQNNESLTSKDNSKIISDRTEDSDGNDVIKDDDRSLQYVLKDDNDKNIKTFIINKSNALEELNTDNSTVSKLNPIDTKDGLNEKSENNTIKKQCVEKNNGFKNNKNQNKGIDGNIETKIRNQHDVLNNNILEDCIDDEQVLNQNNNDKIFNKLENDVEAVEHAHNTVESHTDKFKDDLQELYIEDFSDSSGKRVICKLCHKNLSKKSINHHLSSCHPGVEPRKTKCELCGRYINTQKMGQHFIRVHADPLKCRFCKQNFEKENDLVSHTPTCSCKWKKHNIPLQVTECSICHEKLQKNSLKRHHAVKHAGLRPVCEHCGRGFGSVYRLNEHYRARHGYEKFTCSHCPFQSASVMGIKNHERRHMGEKAYACHTCGAKFHADYLLRQHLKSHRTERMYKCDTCSARFKTSNALNGHLRYVHRGERRVRKHTQIQNT